MNRRLPLIVVSALLSTAPAPAPVLADAVVAQDFAFGATLAPSAKQAIHGYTLPEQVLRVLQDADLTDLCVFDAEGVQRPLALHTPRDTPAEVSELPLQHFPLEAPPQADVDGIEVQVERDPSGHITRAFSKSLAIDDARIGALIDTSAVQLPIVGLNLALSGPREFTIQVRVEASEDLSSFRELTTATVAHLEHGGHTLSKNLVELPAVQTHYLRLTITPARGTKDLGIESLSARVESPGSAPLRATVALRSHETTTRDGQVFAYTLPGVFHVDRWSVQLPSSTSLAEVTLLSSADQKAAFRVLDRGLFRSEGETRELARTEDDFFELRVSDKGGGIRDGAPQLKLGYLAPQLLFAADAAEPYLLAYGSASARCKRFDEDELVGIVKQGTSYRAGADSVTSGPKQTLRGAAALEPRAAARPVRVYALWAVLVAGVFVLALVARKLLKNVG